MTLLHEALTPETLRFVEREQLGGPLVTFLGLVEEVFPNATAWKGDVITDPDSDDVWLSVTVTTPAPDGDLLSPGDRFLDRWLAAMPWPASERIVLAIEWA